MKNSTQQNIGARQDGTPDVLIGRPTVAVNNATGFSKALARGFAQAGEPLPEWARLPAPGKRCAFTGLSRTSLNEAIGRGDIRAVTVRQPGAMRGIKLVNVASLQSWLAKLDVEQNAHGAKGGE